MDAVRDVLIRLKIQLDGARLPPLDTSAYAAQAKQVEKAQMSSAERVAANQATHMNQRDRAIAKSAQEEMKYRKEAARIEEQAAERQRMATQQQRQLQEQAAKEKRDALSKADQEAAKYAQQEAARQDKASERARQRMATILNDKDTPGPNSLAEGIAGKPDAYRAAGDAYKGAAEGAFTLARGLLLVTAANENDLAVMVQKLALYQGYFDIVKGGYEVVKGITVGNQALAVAQGTVTATTAAQSAATGGLAATQVAATTTTATTATATTGLAAAQGVATGTTAAQAVATNGLTASLVAARAAAASTWAFLTGPLGLALIATGAVGYAAWNRITEATRLAREESERARSKMVAGLVNVAAAAKQAESAHRDLANAIKSSNAFALQSSISSQQFGVQFEGITGGPVGGDRMSERERIDKEASSQAEVFARKRLAVAFEEQKAREEFARHALGTTGGNPANADAFREGGSLYEQLKGKVRSQSSVASNFAASAQIEIGGLQKSASDDPRNADTYLNRAKEVQRLREAALERARQQQQTLITLAQRENDLAKQKLALVVEERNSVQGLINSERQRADANRQSIRDEENRVKSLAQRFGELNQYQQQTIKDIASQVSASGVGSLTEQQRQTLKDSGLGDSTLSKYYLQKGNDAGFGSVAAQLGTFKPGTTDQMEGQGSNETRMEFFARQEQEARSSIAEAERKMTELIKLENDAREKVVAGIAEMASMQPILAAIEKLINTFRAEIEKLNGMVEKASQETKNGQMSRRAPSNGFN